MSGDASGPGRGSGDHASRPLRVWLDDERPVPDLSWTHVLTAEDAISLLDSDIAQDVSLDNDLGEGLAEGRTVAAWMEREARWPTRSLAVHSANADAARTMQAMGEAAGIFERVRGPKPRLVLIEEVFAPYRSTDVTIETLGSPVEVRFDEPVPPELLKDDRPWHVLTGWNPLSVATSRGRNAAANDALRSELDRTGAEVVAARGAGRTLPGETVWEPEEGFAVRGLSHAVAVRLGERFGQQGIFVLDGRGLHVVPCAPADRRGEGLRIDARRLIVPGRRPGELVKAWRALSTVSVGATRSDACANAVGREPCDTSATAPDARPGAEEEERLRALVDPDWSDPEWLVGLAEVGAGVTWRAG